MNILQKKYSVQKGWEIVRNDLVHPDEFELVLIFGSRLLVGELEIYRQVRRDFPKADIIFSSTSGEIIGTQVSDESVSLTAIRFQKSRIKSLSVDVREFSCSYKAGAFLSSSLNTDNLKYLMILSDGQKVNGSELVNGLRSQLPERVIITGGLAGDGANFNKTLVGLNARPTEGKIVAVGFYGDIRIAYGSMGGWVPFGPERVITRSEGNILYELDHQPALDVYKMYLGEYANDLPGSGLMFPLSIRVNSWGSTAVRTIIGINEKERSLMFAGNMPKGFSARFMSANADRLIDGALMAAKNSLHLADKKPELAMLISCVGRKLVLDQRVEEEVEVIGKEYGEGTAMAGFYSYGEISPSINFAKSELHNQTMTITTFSE